MGTRSEHMKGMIKLDNHSSLGVGALLVLLVFSCLFSLSEASVTSINRLRLKKLREEGVPGAATLTKLLEQPEKLYSTILLGGNIVDIVMTSLTTALAIYLFGNTGGTVLAATLASTTLIIIFGEVTPKTLAVLYSESIGLRMAGLIRFFTIVLTPLVFVLNHITRTMFKLLRADIKKSKDEVTEQDLRAIIDIGHEQGVIEEKSRDMFANVFEFAQSTASDVCTPRTDISAIPINATVDEVRAAFDRDKYSRLPVYDESIDNIEGIIHVKDFVFSNHQEDKKDPTAWLRAIMYKPLLTYDSQPIGQLFSAMRERRIPFAVVIDEYGGTSGIVTLEDVVGRVVGGMGDEYEDTEYAAKPVAENEFLVDGSTMLEDANSIMGTNLSSEEFESVGGYVIGKLGRIPEVGDIVEDDGLSFTVTTMDRNRIIEVRIVRGTPSEP